jgi:hypothetical protein
MTAPPSIRCPRGSLLIEVSLGMWLASMLALLIMRASLLALGSNQWTIMQTLTDAFMTRDVALANRLPMADLTAPNSPWPDTGQNETRFEGMVSLGRLAGGTEVTGRLVRFRVSGSDEAPEDEGAPTLEVWRLHSVLTYQVGENTYVKTRAVLRTQ